MEKTRIIMIGVPYLLGDLLESAIGHLSDVALVARKEDTTDAVDCVKRHKADVVIFRLSEEHLQSVCRPLLRAVPDLVVLSITDEDRMMLQCELRPRVVDCGEASVDALINLIRSHVQRRTK